MVSPLRSAHLHHTPAQRRRYAREPHGNLDHFHGDEVHVNLIRSRLAPQILAALIALAPLSTRAQSQAAYAPAPGPTLDAARVGLSISTHATPVPPRIERAALNRTGNVVAGAVAGALTGWLAYSIGVGALSSDHGESYRRGRRRWIIGGAVIGALFGAFTSPPPPPGVATS